MTDTLEDKEEERIITPEKINKARRSFLAHTGMYTAGLVGSAMLGACSDSDSLADIGDDDGGNGNGPNGRNVDQAIGNFALNLEYLEAEFYLFAATGSGIPEDMRRGSIGTQGQVTGGKSVNFGNTSFGQLVRNYANEIAVDEFNHVKVLRQALGDGAVAEPRIALDQAFKAAARAAGISENFDYAANPTNFLLAAFIFEDVGVTAYNGAAPLVTDPNILKVAAGNLAAEAYHAGLIRTVLYAQAFQSGNEDLFNTVQAISDARDQLDRDDDKDQGIDPSLDGNPEYAAEVPDGADGESSNIVPLNATGQAFGRTPTQVLDIVYLNAQGSGRGSGGGFFPNGVNTNDGDLFRLGTNSGSGDGGSGDNMNSGSDNMDATDSEDENA